MPVAGEPNVAFHTVGTFLQRQLVGGQRVLGPISRRAAVGDHEGCSPCSAAADDAIDLCPVPGPWTQQLTRFRRPAGIPAGSHRCRRGLDGGALGLDSPFDSTSARSGATITQRCCGRPTGLRTNR